MDVVLGTEQYVGEAIRESGIPREEIFVITKLPSVLLSFAYFSEVSRACD